MSHFFAYSLLGTIIVAVAPFIRGDEDKLLDLRITVAFFWFVVVMNNAQSLSIRLFPHTVDSLLYRADLFLKLDPWVIGRKVNQHQWFVDFLVNCYNAIALPVTIAYAFERSPVLLRVCVVAPILAFIGFCLVPAVGPAHAFSGFPWGTPTLLAVPEATPRNCFPSMHLGWALLVTLNVRATWLRVAAWIFVAITAVVTVGMGEHYYVDLIASVPFCFAIQWLVEVHRGKLSIVAPPRDACVEER